LARNQQVTNPANTVYSIKRFMGRRHNEVHSEEKLVPYAITGGPEDLVSVECRGKTYTPPEISAMVLGDLKKTAEEYLGEKVTRAVITVPAYFNDSQRQATKDAGEIAGLTVERIINEPTAAALAYGLDKNKSEKIAVFDLGGGTFDISILDIDSEGVYQVLASNGDGHLGGDDYDEELINFVAEEFRKKEGIDLRKDSMALQRLKEACEKAKCELSGTQETSINLPFITADQSGPKHLQMTVTRSKFEQLTNVLTERCRSPVMKCIEDAQNKESSFNGKVDEVILVGGSTRIPSVQKLAQDIFGKEPNRGMNPDEVVAVGAAIQAAILTGDMGQDMVLLDVTPLSLGVTTLGDVFDVVIERNTTIPTSKSRTYSTAEDNQSAVDVQVGQGERKTASANRILGNFRLEGVAPAPRGMPQIEVTFDIDANGILNVSAKDQATGKEQSIQIEGSSGLDKAEVERMRQEAEAHAAEDEKRIALVGERNGAEAQAYEIEKALTEHGEKISAESRSSIEAAINQIKEVIKGDDIDAIKKSRENLTVAAQEIGKIVYEQAKQAKAGPARPGDAPEGEPAAAGAAKDDNVIDADFEVKE
jgi:molecular chaperone DnaK